jgi:hypothetical protein
MIAATKRYRSNRGATHIVSVNAEKPITSKGLNPGRTESPSSLPPIICAHCDGPIVRAQSIDPLFSAKLVKWSAHPVLSKPIMLHGVVPTDGSLGRRDLSLGEQLRRRAAIGGEKERAELATFEALLAKSIADALVAQVRDEPEAHGVDVWTWLAREHGKDGAQARRRRGRPSIWNCAYASERRSSGVWSAFEPLG